MNIEDCKKVKVVNPNPHSTFRNPDPKSTLLNPGFHPRAGHLDVTGIPQVNYSTSQQQLPSTPAEVAYLTKHQSQPNQLFALISLFMIWHLCIVVYIRRTN